MEENRSIAWSPGGQVCYIQGEAWGIGPTLLLVYCGTQPEIEKALEQGTGSKSPLVTSILQSDKEAALAKEKAKATVPVRSHRIRLQRRKGK